MLKISRYKALALMLCTLFMLAACGQKGDLYLPEGETSNITAE
jgi:predicted small lipoprotein YifL